MEFYFFLLVIAEFYTLAYAEGYRSDIFAILQAGNITVNQSSAWRENAINQVTCAHLCLSDALCTSILYNKQGQVCHGYHSDLVNSIAVTETPSSNVYLVRTKISEIPDTFEECESIDYCPPHYQYNSDVCLCYKVDMGQKRRHSDALTGCQRERARLLRITSPDTQAFIKSEITYFSDFHIDGKEGFIPGDWFFSNGDKITTFFWSDEYMYTYVEGPSCLALDRTSKLWINRDCEMTEHFICQFDMYSANEENADYGVEF